MMTTAHLGGLWNAAGNLGLAHWLADRRTHPGPARFMHNMVVDHGRSISTTCGLLMRARSFFGVVSRERLEAALDELVNTNELRSVKLLNSDGEAVASAGVPFDFAAQK